MADIEITNARVTAHYTTRADQATFGENNKQFSEVVLTGFVTQGSHDNGFMVTLRYLPESGVASPMFPSDSLGYPGLPVDPDPTKTYTVTFTENP